MGPRRFQFGRGLFVLLEALVISRKTDLPVHHREKRYAADTSLYFSLFAQLLLLFSCCTFSAPSRWHTALSVTFRFIYIISLILYHFAVYFKLHRRLRLYPLKRCVRPYSHTQQVVVLLDSSPTGILPAPVVIVTDVQPQDIAFLCSQFLRVLCVM